MKTENAERCSEYYYANREERLKKQKEYYYKNREARLAYARKKREQRKQYMSAWQKENKHLCNASNSKRRALRLSAFDNISKSNKLKTNYEDGNNGQG